MLPCVYHYALAEFEVFHKGFPKLQWFVFLWPRWRDFLEIEGQYHVRPPTLLEFGAISGGRWSNWFVTFGEVRFWHLKISTLRCFSWEVDLRLRLYVSTTLHQHLFVW